MIGIMLMIDDGTWVIVSKITNSWPIEALYQLLLQFHDHYVGCTFLSAEARFGKFGPIASTLFRRWSGTGWNQGKHTIAPQWFTRVVSDFN
jgi:hypothetical protein